MCDAASAALMFCAADPNVTGMILVNPWARSESSYAQATLKHYYRGQLLSAAFWRRLLGGEVAVVDALRSLLDNLKSARRRDKAPAPANAGDFRARMAAGMRKFPGPVLLLISGQDLTAREFVAHAGSDPKWHWLLDSGHIERADLPEADHTFSSATWRRWVEEKSLSWLDLISDQPQPHESRAPEPGLRDKPHAAGEPGWSAD
jgi:exosortase A-associated hydrolase 1